MCFMYIFVTLCGWNQGTLRLALLGTPWSVSRNILSQRRVPISPNRQTGAVMYIE